MPGQPINHMLDFPRHGLVNLLEMYCDFTPDKRYQLADWRIRCVIFPCYTLLSLGANFSYIGLCQKKCFPTPDPIPISYSTSTIISVMHSSTDPSLVPRLHRLRRQIRIPSPNMSTASFLF